MPETIGMRCSRVNERVSEELREIGERCAARPTVDDRTEDEVLGYDENGLPR